MNNKITLIIRLISLTLLLPLLVIVMIFQIYNSAIQEHMEL